MVLFKNRQQYKPNGTVRNMTLCIVLAWTCKFWVSLLISLLLHTTRCIVGDTGLFNTTGFTIIFNFFGIKKNNHLFCPPSHHQNRKVKFIISIRHDMVFPLGSKKRTHTYLL